MKIAVVYNRESQSVINLFGIPNREKYGKPAINRIMKGLKEGGHQVISLEGDKDLIDRLEEFMPRVLKGERPGMVFNLSYGIQGQARYTHIPGILEMIGIPYVGSGPLAHSLCLDKVVSKMIFQQHGLPTPAFAVLNEPGFPQPDLPYPLIVKPKNEAVSFGIRIVNNTEELRDAAQAIFDQFDQPVLAEQYIAGREVNVGILGNNPPEAFAPAEITFGKSGPQIYTYEDKTRKSGREIGVACPAPLSEEMTKKAQDLAVQAFKVLGCFDCARVDMRLDDDGNFYILELNSLPSLGEHGSYVAAAAQIGLDFPALINRLVEVASARYFGTPNPPELDKARTSLPDRVFSYITQHRDRIERRIEEWAVISSRTGDPQGIQLAVQKLAGRMEDLGLRAVEDLTDEKFVWTWQSQAGLDGGTLLVAHIDAPLDSSAPFHGFRREPEWLHGDGIASAKAPWVLVEFALRPFRSERSLRRLPLGVLCFADEGYDCRYSAKSIKSASEKAARVIVLRPSTRVDRVVPQRRGLRTYQLILERKKLRAAKVSKGTDIVHWTLGKLGAILGLSSKKDNLGISIKDLKTTAAPVAEPHQLTVTLPVSYLDENPVATLEENIKALLGRKEFLWKLEVVSDRPPMKRKQGNNHLVAELQDTARHWEVELNPISSLYPSAAGFVPKTTPVVCGMGAVYRDLYTPQESVQRISLIQRTLLLAQFLVREVEQNVKVGKV